MFCTNCGQHNTDDAAFCTSCGSTLDQQTIQQQTQQQTQQQPQSAPFQIMQPKKKSKAWLIMIPAVLIIAAIAAGIFLFRNTGKRKLKLGITQEAGTAQAGIAGGVITVDGTAFGAEELEITIPENSHDAAMNYTISTTQIRGHKYGKDVEVISPLIKVENGGGFANTPIKVRIPADIHEGEITLGFYYDRDTGEIEAIPFEEFDSTGITLLTSHFSEFFLAKTTKLYLDGIVTTDTGFAPGKDDWQFTNYGSAIAPGGHCAGQSLTMAWYYFEKHIRENQPELFGLFDNDGFGQTVSFWQDDAHAYRFASVVQSEINWTSPDYQQYLKSSGRSQENVYYAFKFALEMTGEPQFMGIYSTDISGNRTSGHAIIAYKIENRNIYVADPNYPQQTDRSIAFIPGANIFQAYSSGINAADISSGNNILYNEVIFVGKSALVDFDTIAELYDQMTDGTIGNDRFPTLEVLYLSNYSDDPEELVWTITDGIISNYSDSTMPADSKGKIILAASAEYTDVLYSFYDGTTLLLGPQAPDSDGYFYVTVTLADGINELGILAETSDGQRALYADFARVMVSIGDITVTPSPTEEQVSLNSSAAASSQTSSAPTGSVIGKFNFVSRSDGQMLVNYHYIEIFPDGSFEEKYQPKGDTYIGEQQGTWKVENRGSSGNILVLDYGMSITNEFQISADYKMLQTFPDPGETNPLIFYFQK